MKIYIVNLCEAFRSVSGLRTALMFATVIIVPYTSQCA